MLCEGEINAHLVVGATGTIGRAVVTALSRDNEIVPCQPPQHPYTVDLADVESVRAMYRSRNAVSPPWVTETLLALNMDPAQGLSAAAVARSYVESVVGNATGAVLEPQA